MTTWEYFSKRRNINLSDFILQQKFDYEQMCEWCVGRDVMPPDKSVFESIKQKHQASIKPKKKPKPKPKVEAESVPLVKNAKPKRKYTRKKQANTKK